MFPNWNPLSRLTAQRVTPRGLATGTHVIPQRGSKILLVAVALAALLAPANASAECGFGDWPPCVWQDLIACQSGDFAAAADGCINNAAVTYAELFDVDGDGTTTGVLEVMPGDGRSHSLELPEGISVSGVFLGRNQLPTCGTGESEIGVRFEAAPGASEGPFTVPFFMEVKEHWTDRPDELKTFRFVFNGWVARQGPKLVVKATSLTSANPDHGSPHWFIDPDSEIEGLTDPKFLNRDFLDMLMLTSETSSAYKLEIYRESKRPITLADVRMVRYGNVFDEAYCLSLTADGSCEQSLREDAELPEFDLASAGSETEEEGDAGAAAAFTLFLKLGANSDYEYVPADYPSTLELVYPDGECRESLDFLPVDGRIMDPSDLRFSKLEDPGSGKVSKGGTVRLSSGVYPETTHTIKFRLANKSSEDPFSGELTLTDTDSPSGYGFSFEKGDDISVDLDPGESMNFEVVLRTSDEVGKLHRAEVVARYGSEARANHFKIEATTGSPLKVVAVGPTGGKKTLSHGSRYEAPHLGSADEDRVDTIEITNRSDVGVFVKGPTLTHEEGTSYPYIDSLEGLNRTLQKDESASFKVVNGPPGCGVHSTDTIAFEYGPLGGAGQPPAYTEFSFTYATEACVPWTVEFEWNGTAVSPPYVPPYALHLGLEVEPDGVASAEGVMTARLSLPAHRPERTLTVSTTGSGFSHRYDDPKKPFKLEETGGKDVTVTYRPDDFGTSTGALKFKDSATGYTWDFGLSGETCGVEGGESCRGTCAPGLQECSDGTCRSCCGNESNGVCGIQAGGQTCSGDPGAAGFDFDCCQGTSLRWLSDYDGQVPYGPPDQPATPVCLADDRCLSADGSSKAHRKLEGPRVCSTAEVDGRAQGVWFQCEETRAAAEVVIEGLQCGRSGAEFKWLLPFRRAGRRVAGFRASIGGKSIGGLSIEDPDPAIDFTWTPPDERAGTIVKYQIVLQPTDGSGWLYSPRVRFPATRYTLRARDLAPGRSYSTHIRIKFDDGEWGEFVAGGAFAVDPDTTPPSAPGPTRSLDCVYTNNKTCFVEDRTFAVRVDPAADSGSGVDPAGYRVCRSNDSAGWAGCDATMTWTSGVSFAVTGAHRPAPGKRRAYYFRARDKAGNWGPWGNPLYVQTIQEASDTTPPSAPGRTRSLDCVFTSNGTCFVEDRTFVIRVAPATDSGSGVNPTGYRVCRSNDATGWAGCNATMTWTGGVTFAVTGANRPGPGKRRAYYFRAQDEAGNWGAWNSPLYVQTLE